MKSVLRLADRVASNDHPILLLGETGVGKDVLAERIFAGRRETSRELVKLNCAAIPQDLFESEFFGSEAGSFSGSVRDRKGLIESADGGTLFLDEVSEMSLESQGKMLRVLESGEFYRVGGRKPLRVGFRLVSAMNRDPMTAVRDGRMREDFLHRISVITIHIPPLRERPEDIDLFVEHFIGKYSDPLRKKIHREDLDRLRNHSWPGNIRELRNRIISAIFSSENAYLDFSGQSFEDDTSLRTSSVESVGIFDLDENEKELIVRAMKRFGGNRAMVADALGISQSTLYRRLRDIK